MRKIPIGMSRWIAASFMIALATRATGPVVGRTAAQAEVKQHRGQRLDRSDSRDPAGVDQATPPTDLPWHIEVLDQAAGSTGPVVIAGPLAYVGRGPVVAVADLSDPLQPRWVGQSAALYGEVTDLAMTQGHLLATVGRDGIDEHLISLNIAQVTTPRLVGELDLPTSSLGLFAGSGQAWLSVVDQVLPEDGTKVSIMALSLDGSGRPIAQRLWNAAGPGWQRPFHAPILRPVGERDLLVAGLVIDNRFGSIWNFSRELDGRLQPRSRVEYDNRHFSDTENRAMAVDEQGRRAYGSEDSTLRVFDILEDGLLQERGSMTLPGSVGCGGLTWTGRWLLATSGCRGSTSVALIDAADPDAPRLAAALTSGRSIARLAMSGKHLVATGGDQGGLTVLRADQLPSMSELGHLEEVPVYTGVVQTVSGRFGIAEGQGIVRLGAPTQAAWAQSALVYALPDVLDLVAGPDGQLVAAEGRRYDAGPAQLHVLSTSGTGLHLEQRIALEASIAGDLTVIGRNLYVGLSQMWKEESRVAPVQRWSFGPNGLTLDARTDPRVNGSCFEVDDKVYVAVSGGMILLDPLSLVAEVLGTDQAQPNVCGFALRTAAGKPPRFVRADDNAVFIQQLEGDKLKTIGRIAPDWPHGVGTVHRLHDVGGYVAALGDAGMFLVDGRSETQLHPLASFPMQWPTDLTPLDAGSPSLAPGRRWVLSSADLGMLLVTTVASPKPSPPIVASPQTWASPTLAPARPLPTAAATPPARRLFLPMVADHERVAWPNPFAEIRSIGPHYRGMATDGDRAWVGDGLTVALLANDGQSATMLDRSANLPAAPRLLVTAPDLLLAVAGQRGLVILSRARDEAPEVLGRLELPDKIVDLVVTADHAYAATTFCGIIAIDLGKPAMPRITSVLDTPTLTRQLLVVDGRLLSRGDAVDSTVAVAIASLANPAVPEWKHQQNLPYFQMATTDGTRLITDAQLEDSQYRLAAFTFNSDETLVEDRPWIEALQTAAGAE
ncbi:MAG TPA: hypothetical protein PK826_15630, partial [Anaerolineae bacterium]|nr:hypothetical protein [Anaerolineae bacterium]